MLAVRRQQQQQNRHEQVTSGQQHHGDYGGRANQDEAQTRHWNRFTIQPFFVCFSLSLFNVFLLHNEKKKRDVNKYRICQQRNDSFRPKLEADEIVFGFLQLLEKIKLNLKGREQLHNTTTWFFFPQILESVC